jgi:predicted double-glycine peptidase
MRGFLIGYLCCAMPIVAAAGERVQSLQEMREHDVIVQKWDTSCGAAALATVLNFEHSDPISERDITAAMLKETGIPKVKYRGGFSLLDLKRYANGRGYAADGYADMTMADLPDYLPLIVPIEVRGFPHFVVVRGFVGNRIAISDPAWGNRTMPVSEFDQAWTLKIGFVVARPGEKGPPPGNKLVPRPSDRLLPGD